MVIYNHRHPTGQVCEQQGTALVCKYTYPEWDTSPAPMYVSVSCGILLLMMAAVLVWAVILLFRPVE